MQGRRQPTSRASKGLRLECADEGIVLFDHFVMTRHEWRSIRALSEGPGASSSW